jgi:hypothetical protein
VGSVLDPLVGIVHGSGVNITPTTLTISQLLGSQNEQYVIPAYQRRYSWSRRQVGDLWDDIWGLEGKDVHLLGTIVCLTGYHTAGLNRLELVDGQQRLTTISILLHCLLRRLRRENQEDEVRDLERLLRAKPQGGAAEVKIKLDSMDAAQFSQHCAGEEPSVVENQRLEEAFLCFDLWIDECEIEEVHRMLYYLQNQAVIIRLDVSDAKDAFKLFETINNRGLRLSEADIIKNFVLGNAARFGAGHLQLAQQRWASMIRNLDRLGVETFFRHLMIAMLRTRITFRQLVERFVEEFMLGIEEAQALPERRYYGADDEAEAAESEDDPLLTAAEDLDDDEPERAGVLGNMGFASFMDRLVAQSKAYREVSLAQTGNSQIDRRLRNLRLIKSVQTYGLLMSLRVNGCSDSDFLEVLRLTETFILRRHVCQERTNENETLFAKLCGVDASAPVDAVRAAYAELTPSDDKFREQFATAQFVRGTMDRARYCLEQMELHLQGEHAELAVLGSDQVHVEHIIPQKIKTRRALQELGDWPSYLGAGSEAKHPRYVNLIGNLTLFAGELNIGASNHPYGRKKEAYTKSSLKLTHTLPTAQPEFRFAQVETRSRDLAELAVQIWPMPKSQG